MHTVELYRKVRLACRDGMSERAAALHFGISRESVKKMLCFSVPPGYRRTAPVRRPKLDGFTEIIDQWLKEDLKQLRKQRHTAKRIFDRLRAEHGFSGGYTIVKDYVREHHRRRREMFVPLTHPPGHGQADFGEARAVIGGVARKAHFFVFDLPHSDACYVRAYPAATAEAWIDGHVHAFAFFGGVPQSVLYDNDRCLVSRILADGTRRRARLFNGFLSHYLVRDRYGRPGKGNDKGAVEGLVGFSRRNFMVPLPRFASWEAFNRRLEEQCRRRQGDILRGHRETIGERLRRDLEAMAAPPAAPFEACAQSHAKVRPLAQVAVFCAALRLNLQPALTTQLAAGDWIRQGHNLILGGPTGSGKTFVACALAHQACRQHQSVLYRRVPELVAALIRARDKGTLERLMGRLGRVSLLVLDDWGLQGFSAEGRRDLLEIVEARHGRKSILVASQIPVERWPEVIGEPTIADAVLDRIVHNAYRIELKGESQRKRNKPPPLDGGGSGNRAPA